MNLPNPTIRRLTPVLALVACVALLGCALAATPAAAAGIPTPTPKPLIARQGTATEPASAPAETGVVLRSANLRAGPGTQYAIVGSAAAGQTVKIAATNPAGDWYHLTNGHWIAGFLVDVSGKSRVTPAAVPVATAAAAKAAPAAAPTATPAPAQAAAPAAATAGNDFVLTERRLWDVYENGGSLDGPSVHCGDDRVLHVNVLDRNGSRVNGIAVQVQYGAREIEVTGAQGKGDGVAEFVLGGGQDVKVVRDNDGSPVTSDLAAGLSTNPASIAYADLMAARYCRDEAECRQFAAGGGCNGHFSWSVTFQRR